MSLGNDFIEFLGLGHGHGRQAEVIDDQHIRGQELSQCLFPCTVGPCRIEPPEQFRRFDEQRGMTCSTGLIAQGLGYVGWFP